ncbi:hypothetical protein AGMMS49975_24200 [Clostridia bacterium]|nr:hypothetical protein AGMMS49975_24200 [Clostridia bacterium]
MNNYTSIEKSYLAEQARQVLARRCLMDFTRYTNANYSVNWHHRTYANALDDFAAGKIKKLMVFMPPQHGKSELCSRRLPAKILGDKPDTRIALVSYNHDFAAKFNRDVQRIIDTPEYRTLYPDTSLNTQNIRTVVGTWLRNADEFEIVGRRGSLVTVGTGGGLTGRAVDVLIIDDPYKDPKSAWSLTTRQSTQDWYDAVACSRLHNDSKQLITLTRWHPDDLAGTLLTREADEWTVVKYQAIKSGEPTAEDPRANGEALWAERHSLEQLLQIKKSNSHVFQSLYQQDPKPVEGLIYSYFVDNLKDFMIQPDELPKRFDHVLIGVDWGDAGSLHSFTCVGLIDDGMIVLDSDTYPTKGTTPADLERAVVKFAAKQFRAYGRIESVNCDRLNTLINGVRTALQEAGLNIPVMRAHKAAILDRILATSRLMGSGRLLLLPNCKTLIKAFSEAVWSPKEQDKRLDNGTTDIDSLDSFEYVWGGYFKKISGA